MERWFIRGNDEDDVEEGRLERLVGGPMSSCMLLWLKMLPPAAPCPPAITALVGVEGATTRPDRVSRISVLELGDRFFWGRGGGSSGSSPSMLSTSGQFLGIDQGKTVLSYLSSVHENMT